MLIDIVLFCYLLAILPRLIYLRLARGKKYPGLRDRLGMRVPHPGKRPVIWIHAVSVGEVKAARPFLMALKQDKNDAYYLVTTTTATGQAEAMRSLPADAYRYLPLDFRWIVRRWVRALKPELFFLVESDFWPNLLSAITKEGGKAFLLSGKISSRSARRFGYFPRFSRKLFGYFTQLFVQNEEQRERFLPLVPDPSRLIAAGNLKFDMTPQKIGDSDSKFSSFAPLPVITIASTHAPEELFLLEALQGLSVCIFLAPRHPERIKEVEALLEKKHIPYTRWTQPYTKPERLILVDAMGHLPVCYAQSHLALVGGSFFPGVGGHNILEPCLYGCPVLFGPHMESQTEMARLFLSHSRAGSQIARAELKAAVSSRLAEEPKRSAALELSRSVRGSTATTYGHVRRVLNMDSN